MFNWSKLMALAGMAAVLNLGSTGAQAQEGGRGNRGNFDPAQMRERMMERTKENLEITSGEEWKAIEPLVGKVMEARMQSLAGGRGGMAFGGQRRPGGDNNNAQGGERPRMFGQSPEADALQKAVDAKASKAELKAALEKYTAARKAKQAELEKAQENLRKVLTARQEALATLNGLL